MLPSELLMVRVTDGLAGLKADPESREKLGAHQGPSTSCLWLCPRLSYKVGLYHALFNGVPDDMRRFYEHFLPISTSSVSAGCIARAYLGMLLDARFQALQML